MALKDMFWITYRMWKNFRTLWSTSDPLPDWSSFPNML